MKHISKCIVATLAVFGFAGMQSCTDDDNRHHYYYDDYYADLLPNALVTVKTSVDNIFYMQLDDNTRLFPTNLSSSPFGEKEVRALVNYNIVEPTIDSRDLSVHVNWIDSLLTKSMATDLGETENDEIYGNDPVEIVKDWVTIAEDGYLTLRFRTLWSQNSQPHFVNLLYTDNPDNPYEVEFRHNAYGDTHGHTADGLVAFRLDQLPDTEGNTVKLTLKWQSFSGEKSTEFDYCTRASTTSSSTEAASVRNSLNLK